jgi:hypothetical protein
LRTTYKPGMNLGFRAGRWSRNGHDAIVVLDGDVRDERYRHEMRAAWKSLVGPFPPTVLTGSDCPHLYLRCPPDKAPNVAAITLRSSDLQIRRGVPAWKIELLSTGKNVVAPPSVHPDTGKEYRFVDGGLDNLPIVPDSVLDALAYSQREAPGEWPEPEPIRTELLPVERLPVEIIPEPYRAWNFDIANRMGCPLDFPAAGAIVVTSSIIGAGCGMKPKQRDDWLIIPNVWGALIGEPGVTMKSPALGEIMRPLDRLIARAREDHERASRAYVAQAACHEAKMHALKDEMKRAAAPTKKIAKKGTAEDATSPRSLDELRQEYAELTAPQKPEERRYKTNNATIEKISELLNNNPRGLLYFRDELTGWLATLDKEGHEPDRAFYLETWNGYCPGGYDTDRILRGSIHTTNMCLAILGGIQPDKLLRYLWETMNGYNDGLLQRFQVSVWPDWVHSELVDEYPNTSAKNRAFETIAKLAQMNFREQGANLDTYDPIPFYRFSPDAQELFYRWLKKLQRKIKNPDESPYIAQHLTKYRKLFPALALTFHLIRIADGAPGGPVTLECAELAAAWCEYLESHARRIYGLVLDARLQAAAKLADKIRRGALRDGFTVRDVYRQNWRFLNQRELVQAACDELVEADWLRERITQPAFGQVGVSGRGKMEYFVNPKARVKDG